MLVLWLRRASLAERGSRGAARAAILATSQQRTLWSSGRYLQGYRDRSDPTGRRTEGSAHVPFVDDGLTLGSDDPSFFTRESAPAPRLRSSDIAGSITVKERAAFASLFDKASRVKPSRVNVTGNETPDQDAFGPRTARTSTSPTPSTSPTGINVDSFPTPIQDLAARAQGRIAGRQKRDDKRIGEQRILEEVRAAVAERKEAITTTQEQQVMAAPAKTPIDNLRESHQAYVAKLLLDAETDQTLWAVLEEHVFDVVKGLQLDRLGADPSDQRVKARGRPTQNDNTASSSKAAKSKRKKKQDQTTPSKESTSPAITNQDAQSDAAAPVITAITSKTDLLSLPTQTQLSIIGTNYSTLLTLAAQILCTKYPTSDLPNAILPTCKSLGRASYILGASTPLYNTLIKHIYATSHDFTEINRLLAEMENAALDFDNETFELVYEIRREGFRALRGEKGTSLQGVWKTDVVHEGWRSVVQWWPVLRGRLGVPIEAEG